MSAAQRVTRVHLAILVAITLVATGLRFWGIERLLPHRFEPDAFIVYVAEDLRLEPGRQRTQESSERYPMLLARSVAKLPLTPLPVGLPPEQAQAAHLERASHTFVQVRTLVAIFSILLVPLTFLLALRFLWPSSALVASAFVATSLLSMFFSDQARPHGVYATLVIVGVLLAAEARRRASTLWLVAAGVVAGLSLGVLQTGVFILPPIVAAAALMPGRWLVRGARALAALVVALVVAYPFNDFLPVIDSNGITMSGKGGHAVRLSEFNGGGFAITWESLWGQDPALTVCAFVGLVWLVLHWWKTRPLAHERRSDLLVVLGHAAPYTLVLVVNEHISERYFLPLLPGLACAAAFALERVSAFFTRVSSRAVSLALCAALAFAVAWVPVTNALLYAQIARAPDTYETATQWIDEHVERADKLVVVASVALPMLHTRAALDRDLADFSGQAQPWFTYQDVLPPEELARGHQLYKYPTNLPENVAADEPSMIAEARRWLDVEKPQWVVVEDSRALRSSAWARAFTKVVRERGELAWFTRGEVGEDVRETPHPYQNAYYLAFRLHDFTCWGPRVEVYRWP